MSRIQTVILFFIFLWLPYSNPSFGQNNNHRPLTGIYNRYPWEGQSGYKTNLNFSKTPGIELGFLLSDIPKKQDADYHDYFGSEGWCVANQNIFLTTEIKDNLNISLKIGYELNIVIVGGRVSYIRCFDLSNGTSGGIFLPEAGLSLFGFLTLFYGYALPTDNVKTELNHHSLSLGINWVYFNH
ncbi:MAG: hypothetical protein IT247_07380 [Bacteroidia bacterium]|nr:hypothetical protein [Bacteroidia bacterium]